MRKMGGYICDNCRILLGYPGNKVNVKSADTELHFCGEKCYQEYQDNVIQYLRDNMGMGELEDLDIGKKEKDETNHIERNQDQS